MTKLVVTIMAAGEGKRMNSDIPKVLHHFHSVPMLIRIIFESYKLFPDKIIIITGKYHDLIVDTIQKYLVIEYFDIFQSIVFVKQEIPNGTGDAIKSTLHMYSDNDNVLILNGDMPLISATLLHKLIDNTIKSNTESLHISPVSKILVAKLENPFGYGRIIYNNGIFIGIKEEKDCSPIEREIDIVNVGIYYFHSKVLKQYIPLITNNNSQSEYYLTDIITIIREHSDIHITTHLVENEHIYQIMGVNTQNELLCLEKQYQHLA